MYVPEICFRRMVIKAGTTLLTGGSDKLDLVRLKSLVEQMSHLYHLGVEVLLVTSGAVATGRQVLRLSKGSDMMDKVSVATGEGPFRQVLASIGQGRLMQMYAQEFSKHDITVAQALLTRNDIADRLGYLNIRSTLLSLLSLGVIPILNENDVVALEELQGEIFGDNDTLSSLVSNIVDADLLVMLGDIEGLYTSNPENDSDARLIPLVERTELVESYAWGSNNELGRGGMVAKLAAAQLATASGATAVIADGRFENVLQRIVSGEQVGTIFLPTSSNLESRERWLLSAINQKGTLTVDQGAANALKNENSSLLPAGVSSVVGLFSRGQVVAVRDDNNETIAAGIVNYDSQDVKQIMGAHLTGINEILGHDFGEEVVHRNNMVIF
jgi:glutamate 5-kinase